MTIADSYSYDGYGVLLQDDSIASQRPGHVSQQATNLLYSGEHFDTDSQQYYNRARWYDPLNGRFNRMDPYAGSMQDPQSLHKYLYCHANPINNIDPTGNMTITEGIVTIAVVGILASIAVRPQMWARMGSYGIKETKTPKNIAVINGKLGGSHEWSYAWSGVNIHEFSSELSAAGHNVTYSVLPNEEEFVNILNSNEIVVLVAHGLDIWDRVGTGDMLDNIGNIFAGVVLGGNSSHKYDDPIKDSITDFKITPSDTFVTANEIDERITNSQLELIAISCQLGKTKRFAEAISPGAFVGSKIDLGGPSYRNILGYATDRANGIQRSTAFSNLQKKGDHYVNYP